MPEYIVRQVMEARIRAENIDVANYVGAGLINGDPLEDSTSEILEEPTVKVFVVEED